MPYVTEANLTEVVFEHWKNIPDTRLRQIMQLLIKYLHTFVRDAEATQAEWAYPFQAASVAACRPSPEIAAAGLFWPSCRGRCPHGC